MVDYGKKTVADLQEILKSRSLPSSGKKADLVARLQEADQAAGSNGMSHDHVIVPQDESNFLFSHLSMS